MNNSPKESGEPRSVPLQRPGAQLTVAQNGLSRVGLRPRASQAPGSARPGAASSEETPAAAGAGYCCGGGWGSGHHQYAPGSPGAAATKD
jgi:hypothetical protein